jgi:hypothetical protein
MQIVFLIYGLEVFIHGRRARVWVAPEELCTRKSLAIVTIGAVCDVRHGLRDNVRASNASRSLGRFC